MDPYPIWGNGRQDRDFTYVTDIVEGTVRSAERITDGSAINLGNGKRYTMIEVANTIFDLVGWRPREIFFDTSKPTGAVSRALDIQKARNVLGWEPKVSFRDGLAKTIEWYLATHNVSAPTDERILLERA